jgi:hypothetical protein
VSQQEGPSVVNAPAGAEPSPSLPPSLDRALETARNRVSALVYDYLSIWDHNAGRGEPIVDLLSPEGFTITSTLVPSPPRIITTIDQVRQWYADTAQQVRQVNHLVESIDVSALRGEVWQVHVVVRALGISIEGRPFLARSDQRWEVVDYGGLLPRIRQIDVVVTVSPG